MKKYKMEKSAVKELMYGGVHELSKNRRYYYHSTVGAEYSHWTEEGMKALSDYMNLMAFKMAQAEEAAIKEAGRAMVLQGLKGD